MIRSTTRLTRVTSGSGSGSRARRKASAAAASSGSPGAASSSATSQSPAGPKTSATVTRRSVRARRGAEERVEAGRPERSRARPWPSSSRVNRPVSTPMIPSGPARRPGSSTGEGRVCWVWGSRPRRSQRTVQKILDQLGQVRAAGAATSKHRRPARGPSAPRRLRDRSHPVDLPMSGRRRRRRVSTSLPSVGGPTLAAEVIRDDDHDSRQGDRIVHDQGLGRAAVGRGRGGAKLTQARVTTTYTGDLEGEGTAQLLMVYDGADAAWRLRAGRRVAGRPLGQLRAPPRRGSRAGAARTTWTVVGVRHGDLAGLGARAGMWPGGASPRSPGSCSWSLE